ncbi:54S ribosomal protein L17 [Yarrowia sp. C11]|nr:54S ribosomal protein L17 [Yarrowia sp. C11]KAG5370620.1 54S ribosomal protein L17 [Yarrowia sp. E02]
MIRAFSTKSSTWNAAKEAVAETVAETAGKKAGRLTAETRANISGGMILSRIPIVTSEPTPFAKQYYQYMDGLKRQMMFTFPSFLYYKRGTLAERKYRELNKIPTQARDGVVYPEGIPDVVNHRERSAAQQIALPPKGIEGTRGAKKSAEESEEDEIKPNSRVTEADQQNNTKSLERKLDRTLYLLAQTKNGWRFPSVVVNEKETIDEAAKRGIHELGGPNMNIWNVSHTPAGFFKNGDKREFYVKSHIVQGQFEPAKDVQDYAWLTKEEIQAKVDGQYYQQLHPLLNSV